MLETGDKSRGQRQRIKKRIAYLFGETVEKKPEDDLSKKQKKMSAKDRIAFMLNKREQKMEQKANAAKSQGLTKEDRAIKNEIRNKKKDKRKAEPSKEEDQFDELLEKYQTKLLKKMAKVTKGGESESTPFQEVDISD